MLVFCHVISLLCKWYNASLCLIMFAYYKIVQLAMITTIILISSIIFIRLHVCLQHYYAAMCLYSVTWWYIALLYYVFLFVVSFCVVFILLYILPLYRLLYLIILYSVVLNVMLCNILLGNVLLYGVFWFAVLYCIVV